MGTKGAKWAAELRNVEIVPTLNDLAVQTIHGGSNSFNFQSGILAKSGISVGDLSVGGGSDIVVEHNFSGASVSAAFYIRIVEGRNSAWR